MDNQTVFKMYNRCIRTLYNYIMYIYIYFFYAKQRLSLYIYIYDILSLIVFYFVYMESLGDEHWLFEGE